MKNRSLLFSSWLFALVLTPLASGMFSELNGYKNIEERGSDSKKEDARNSSSAASEQSKRERKASFEEGTLSPPPQKQLIDLERQAQETRTTFLKAMEGIELQENVSFEEASSFVTDIKKVKDQWKDTRDFWRQRDSNSTELFQLQGVKRAIASCQSVINEIEKHEGLQKMTQWVERYRPDALVASTTEDQQLAKSAPITASYQQEGTSSTKQAIKEVMPKRGSGKQGGLVPRPRLARATQPSSSSVSRSGNSFITGQRNYGSAKQEEALPEVLPSFSVMDGVMRTLGNPIGTSIALYQHLARWHKVVTEGNTNEDIVIED